MELDGRFQKSDSRCIAEGRSPVEAATGGGVMEFALRVFTDFLHEIVARAPTGPSRQQARVITTEAEWQRSARRGLKDGKETLIPGTAANTYNVCGIEVNLS